MVTDSASEEESRYRAENSCLPMYSSMRKGVICIRKVSQQSRICVESQIDGAIGIECAGATGASHESTAAHRLETDPYIRAVELRPGSTLWRATRKRILGEAGLRVGRPDRHGAVWTKRSNSRENDGNADSPK